MILRTVCFLVAILFHPFISRSQTEAWQLAKDENGIKVYTRHAEGFEVDELKAVLTMKAPLNAIVAVMVDVDHYVEWIYACTESRIIQKVSETEQYQYMVSDVPYPFSDRDNIVHFKVWQDSITKSVFTSSIGVPDFIPETEGRVRVPVYIAEYELTPLPNGEVNVSYQLRLNPGGKIPDWMLNLFIIKGPYESTLKMRQRVETGKYDNTRFSFLK